MRDNLQKALNAQRGLCRCTPDVVVPCHYHADRLRCRMFAIRDNVVQHDRGLVASLDQSSSDLRQMGRLFRAGEPPAGSWYLVKEQREWLRDRLVEEFDRLAGLGRVPRLLEAGVASAVHHYGYIRVVLDALERSRADAAIVHVVDVCCYPLLQIAVIDRQLTQAQTVAYTRVDIGGHDWVIRQDFLDAVGPEAADLSRVGTLLHHEDLRESDPSSGIGTVDIVTEHFLSSCLDKQFRDAELRAIRARYVGHLAGDGCLLVAAGVRPGTPKFTDFERMHTQAGLLLDGRVTLSTWDPYGLKTADVLALGDTREPMPITLDNVVVRFVRAAGSP